jgi:hypothetical protein
MTDRGWLAPDINESMNQFRRASREIFNNYFRRADLDRHEVFLFCERYFELNDLLFEMLVTDCPDIEKVRYGNIQPKLQVKAAGGGLFPSVMINREVNSGYWDFPLKELPEESVLLFMSYFDWDEIDFRDHQYVRAHIQLCDAHPEVVGKEVLIEALNVKFAVI